MSDDVIERVARAVADLEETNGLPPLYQDIATAALAALRAGDTLPNGLVVTKKLLTVDEVFHKLTAMRDAAKDTP